MKQNIAAFIRLLRLKQLLIRVTLMMYLSQPAVRLYETYKSCLERVLDGFFIYLQVKLLTFQSTTL